MSIFFFNVTSTTEIYTLSLHDALPIFDDLSTGNMDNLRAVQSDTRLRAITSRISDCAELGELAAHADAIFHLAAAVGVELVVHSPIHVLRTNIHETEVLLEAAAAGGKPPVLIT